MFKIKPFSEKRKKNWKEKVEMWKVFPFPHGITHDISSWEATHWIHASICSVLCVCVCLRQLSLPRSCNFTCYAFTRIPLKYWCLCETVDGLCVVLAPSPWLPRTDSMKQNTVKFCYWVGKLNVNHDSDCNFTMCSRLQLIY